MSDELGFLSEKLRFSKSFKRFVDENRINLEDDVIRTLARFVLSDLFRYNAGKIASEGFVPRTDFLKRLNKDLFARKLFIFPNDNYFLKQELELIMPTLKRMIDEIISEDEEHYGEGSVAGITRREFLRRGAIKTGAVIAAASGITLLAPRTAEATCEEDRRRRRRRRRDDEVKERKFGEYINQSDVLILFQMFNETVSTDYELIPENSSAIISKEFEAYPSSVNPVVASWGFDAKSNKWLALRKKEYTADTNPLTNKWKYDIINKTWNSRGITKYYNTPRLITQWELKSQGKKWSKEYEEKFDSKIYPLTTQWKYYNEYKSWAVPNIKEYDRSIHPLITQWKYDADSKTWTAPMSGIKEYKDNAHPVVTQWKYDANSKTWTASGVKVFDAKTHPLCVSLEVKLL